MWALVGHLDEGPFIRLPTTGGNFDRTSFNRYFRTWVREAGLPARCTPHGLRHRFCIEAAGLPGVIQAILKALTGIRDPGILMHYLEQGSKANFAAIGVELREAAAATRRQ